MLTYKLSMDYWSEIEGKQVHDPFFCPSHHLNNFSSMTTKDDAISRADRCLWFPGPIIVGAGPSGLALAACLKEKGIKSLVLERSNCIASLWQNKTYDRLCLHLPKKFCELPLMPFPATFPKYPSKQQFITYLENYARQYDIQPQFNETVVSAEYESGFGLWRVRTMVRGEKGKGTEYVCRWLVVSTGENAEAVVPEIEGMEEFKGPVVHTSLYKSGDLFRGKRVLVVGSGNSGMEVCLDLYQYNAYPTIVIRDAVHILPREMLGQSTFGLSMWLLKWLPIRTVDRLLLILARVILGDTARFGLHRPPLGPLEVKSISGKTPVLDIGTLARIKSGDVKVRPAIRRLRAHGAEFVDGRSENFDAIVLATGYKSNVPSWLKERKFFSEKDGLPRQPFPNGWKGEHGLYAVGLTKRGLMGASADAKRVAHDIEQCWNSVPLQ